MSNDQNLPWVATGQKWFSDNKLRHEGKLHWLKEHE